MSIDRLGIYIKMGDIAAQISAIERMIHRGEKEMISIGQGSRPLEELLPFQWNRLHLLETMIHEPIKSILSYKDHIYKSLCLDCQYAWQSRNDLQGICEKDWNNYCELILIDQVIIK